MRSCMICEILYATFVIGFLITLAIEVPAFFVTVMVLVVIIAAWIAILERNYKKQYTYEERKER